MNTYIDDVPFVAHMQVVQEGVLGEGRQQHGVGEAGGRGLGLRHGPAPLLTGRARSPRLLPSLLDALQCIFTYFLKMYNTYIRLLLENAFKQLSLLSLSISTVLIHSCLLKCLQSLYLNSLSVSAVMVSSGNLE